ncbi:MAG: ABC transporter substrate-binding protein [Anaerolineae bacterium]|nr:ABC transporter substrate-binding protein [Anaerolineae bacterium]
MFRKLSLLLVCVSLVIAFVAPAAAQDEPVTLVEGDLGNAVQLYGAVVTDGISYNILNQGCESLLRFTGEATSVGPSLAESYEGNEDATEWTFHLRQDVTFQDGTPFNADAVIFNFEAWRFTTNPLHFESQVYEYYATFFNGFDDESLITDIEKIDDYTVKFYLSAPYGPMLNALATSMFQIHSPAALEQYGENYGTPEVGYVCTGPYKFVEWSTDERVVLDLWDGYWGEVEGNVERIIFLTIPDPAARFLALQAGEVDFVSTLDPEQAAIVKDSDTLQLLVAPGLQTFYLGFNYRIKEFNDIRVREAISLAMDRQIYVETFFPPDTAYVATTFLPANMWGFNPDVPAPEYNPDKAIELLAEAGFPDGLSEVNVLGLNEDGTCCTEEIVDTIPLTLYWQPVSRGYNPDGEGAGQAMAADLARIGVNVTLDNGGDWATYLDMRRNGNLLGLFQLGWGADNGDPDNFSGYFFADCNNARESYFNFPEICDLLTQAKALPMQEQREPLYQEADALLAETFGRLTIAHADGLAALSGRVKNWFLAPLGGNLVRYAVIE